MPTELEAKFAVITHEPLRKRLTKIGAQLTGRVLESNSIYDRPDRSLWNAGCGLRVRGIEVLEGEPQTPTLTFKGPVQAGPFKKREELELPLAEAEGMRRLLEAIGFVEVLRFSKRRESWRLNDSRIELDELPLLGRFVEIEGPAESNVRSTQEALGLAGAEHIPQNYVSLLAEMQPLVATRTTVFDFP